MSTRQWSCIRIFAPYSHLKTVPWSLSICWQVTIHSWSTVLSLSGSFLKVFQSTQYFQTFLKAMWFAILSTFNVNTPRRLVNLSQLWSPDLSNPQECPAWLVTRRFILFLNLSVTSHIHPLRLRGKCASPKTENTLPAVLEPQILVFVFGTWKVMVRSSMLLLYKEFRNEQYDRLHSHRRHYRS